MNESVSGNAITINMILDPYDRQWRHRVGQQVHQPRPTKAFRRLVADSQRGQHAAFEMRNLKWDLRLRLATLHRQQAHTTFNFGDKRVMLPERSEWINLARHFTVHNPTFQS